MLKIGYLIDENVGWDDDPEWRFYDEASGNIKLYNRGVHKSRVKRIVYAEIPDEEE